MSDFENFELSLRAMLKELCNEHRLFSNSLQYGKDDSGDEPGFKKIRSFEEDYPASSAIPHEERRGVYSPGIALIKEVASARSKYKGFMLVKIRDTYKSVFNMPSDAEEAKPEKDYFKFYISPNSEELMPSLKGLVEMRLQKYKSSANSFGCCSSFNDCSDAKHCVHYNQLYATGCTYRIHLDKGEIFYGKNRNID